MKKHILWILGVVLAILLFSGAYFLYHHLQKEYALDPLSNSQSSTSHQTDKFSAPDFTVVDDKGNEVQLSDYFGKPIVLNFWASWCYYCKEEMPDFQKAYEAYPDVQFLMVNATDNMRETETLAKDYISLQGFSFPVFFDTRQQAVLAYSVSGLPATFFLDKTGNLVTYANGMLDFETLKTGIEMIKE